MRRDWERQKVDRSLRLPPARGRCITWHRGTRRTHTRTVPGRVSIHFAHERRGRPSPRQAGGCGGAGGAPSRLAKPRAVRAKYGRQSSTCVSETKSSVSPHLHPSSVLSSRSTGDEDWEKRCQRKRANGGRGVATGRDRYTGFRNTSARRWGEGAAECGQQRAGTTACASRPAACAASPGVGVPLISTDV
ncbi:hypothetical protein B0H14DRAFT_1154599 [Mycena olivaceomarginata]|nr:hypothetical protein B0H14DRAFT_1154599 [Mycena olivaceomarginata]